MGQRPGHISPIGGFQAYTIHGSPRFWANAASADIEHAIHQAVLNGTEHGDPAILDLWKAKVLIDQVRGSLSDVDPSD